MLNYLSEDYTLFYQHIEKLDLDLDSEIQYIQLIAKQPNLFKHLDDPIKNNTYFIAQLVQNYGLILEFLSDEQKNDDKIVFECIFQNSSAFKFASDRLKNDKNFLFHFIDRNADNYFLLSEENQLNPIYIERALKRKSLILEKMPDFVKQDEHYIQIAIHQNGLSLAFAGDKFKHNLDIIREALKYSRGYERDFVKLLPKTIREQIPNNPTFDLIAQTLEKIFLEKILVENKENNQKRILKL
jgi:hypothetical protein